MNKERLMAAITNYCHETKGFIPKNIEEVWFTDLGANVPVEIIQRHAKELGYINGYRWGVEYQTNGEEPDLPDTILVATCKYMSQLVSETNWIMTTNFKITDQRYEPADKSYLSASEVSVDADEIAQAKKEFAAMPTLLQGLMQESFDRLIADMEEKRKAEADKKRVVDAAYNAIAKPNGIGVDAAIAELYDAGFLRMPAE
jgi:hypothetical protein